MPDQDNTAGPDMPEPSASSPVTPDPTEPVTPVSTGPDASASTELVPPVSVDPATSAPGRPWSRRGKAPARRSWVDEDDSVPADDPPEHPWWRSALRWLAEFAVYVLIAVLIVTLVRIFLLQAYLVPSGSMEQTLRNEDRIMTWKPGEPQRGDMVVFRDDASWLDSSVEEAPAWKQFLAWIKVLPPTDEKYLVKRLIGLPGDHVTCCDSAGRITVNGQALDESAYLYYTSPALAQVPFDVVVPEGRVFVLGDHRDGSADSRAHMCQLNTSVATPEAAFPTLESIQGKVFAITWPIDRWQTFSRPAVFDQIPAATESPPSPTEAQWTCPR